MRDGPLLSLVIPARNDSYMGDFKWRFATCLNYLARNLDRIGRLGDVEVVVCDWNSDVPLHRELELSPAAAELVRFLVVPPEVARPIQRDSPFPIVLAQNAAIRRSRGTFIGQTDSDVLYTPATLLALLNLLEGRVPGVPIDRAYWAAPRRQLPYRQVQRRPSLRELDAYLLSSGSLLPQDQVGAGYAAPTALVLLHRDIWHACRGYDQRFLYWGWMDIDLALRVTQRYPLLYLSNFGVNLIHLEHYAQRNYQDPEHQPRRANFPDDDPAFEANDADWGLASHQLELARAERVVDVPETPPAAAGGVVEWDLTPWQVQEQLYASTVQGLLQQWRQVCRIDPADGNALTALAWYALTHTPRLYVEAGMIGATAAALVAAASPGVEVIGLVCWHREVRDETSLAYGAHYVLAGLGRHRAATRFLTGDPATAVERLAASHPGPLTVDLALVRVRDAATSAEQARQLGLYLAPGGALVLLASDATSLAPAAEALRQRHPQFTFLPFNDDITMLVLAARLRSG
ncbi:MAG: glycosyltransferase family 2 protein [Gemmataceae bacterium]|nr:glycosyltransferase family 2 protein [Gemmataceae bacterium]MDW8266725.1 glycosyltransferase family A protein [Gemmataceae bacterium]